MARPTPIPISARTRNLILFAIVFALLLTVWLVPFVLTVMLLGFACALLLSFPVGWFMHFMPRAFAMLLSLLILLVIVVLALLFLVPVIVDQVTALVENLPTLTSTLREYVLAALEPLRERGLISHTPQEIASRFSLSVTRRLDVIARNALGILFGAVDFALAIFAVAFTGICLLSGARNIRAAYLLAVPKAYRGDARELWNELAHTLSHYVGGLGVILLIQGALSATALYFIGVPYYLALGAWVSAVAIIPYFGAWIGAIPALLIAFTVSWTAVLLTLLTFMGIQILEGYVLTPKIQGEALELPAIVVLLAILIGGGIGGLLGVIFAVPVTAVLKVFFDFFRVRLTTVK
ncbi:MAG: AI-2E family transporter [Nitrococcus sp.]|nr:AI-2E family transporter [Nitrococcus sp.]